MPDPTERLRCPLGAQSMTDAMSRLNDALRDRYRVERELGKGGSRGGRWIIPLMALAAMVGGCSESPTGVSTACGPLPYFTALPVAPGSFDFIAAVGWLGAPGHTLPTAHSGFILNRVGAPVFSPGEVQVTGLRRVTFVSSPNRQGETDYTVEFAVCSDVEGWFGHVTTLSSAIPNEPTGENCQTYSTAEETVQSCSWSLSNVTLSAGEQIGTGGLSIELGLMGLDFGLLDYRITNFYATPLRYPTNTFHAVCPYEYFDPVNREFLLTEIGVTGEPRCGTMEVDVVGTAKGVWAEVGVTGPLGGDERRYVTLANNPYWPVGELALSLGPTELGARVAVVPRMSSGRVNRAFEQVTDALVYCYQDSFGNSWLLSRDASGMLRLEWIEHLASPSPCEDDPSTWSLGSNAVSFVR